MAPSVFGAALARQFASEASATASQSTCQIRPIHDASNAAVTTAAPMPLAIGRTANNNKPPITLTQKAAFTHLSIVTSKLHNAEAA
jgi:hypothetical protein